MKDNTRRTEKVKKNKIRRCVCVLGVKWKDEQRPTRDNDQGQEEKEEERGTVKDNKGGWKEDR